METKLRELLLCAVAITAANLLVIDALGQPPRGGRPADKAKKGSPLVKEDMYLKLLSLEPVQQELEISDVQYARFRKIGPELKAKVADLIGPVDEATLTPQQRKELQDTLRSHERELQGWVRQQIDKVLLPQQKQRLRELAIQLDGAKSLGDPGVAKELKLSESQLAEMAKVRDEEKRLRDEVKQLFPGGGKENGELRKEQEAFIRDEAEKRVWAVLTKEQQRAWEKMTGKAFDVTRLKGPPKQPKPPMGAPPLD